MAALTQNIGTQATGPENDTGGPVRDSLNGGATNGLGRVLSEQQKIASTHTALTRFYWTRRALEQTILERMQSQPQAFKVEIDFGRNLGRGDDNANRLHLNLVPAISGESVPWMEYGSKDFGVQRFFGAPAKMGCPSWDLPAGALQLGGTCVGAGAGQSTLSDKTLKSYRPLVLKSLQAHSQRGQIGYPEDVNVANAICQSCYANANNFAYADNQFGMVLRYWWTSTMLSTEQGRRYWVESMVAALQAEVAAGWPLETHSSSKSVPFSECSSGGVSFRPFRVHSSGDFYSPEYMSAWFDVMNDARVQALKIVFWAPTRSWVIPTFREFVAEAHAEGRFPQNLTLRPSGYHFGDQAPKLPAPWAAGTTSLYALREETKRVTFEERGEGQKPKKVTKLEVVLTAPPADGRRDWDCQTYAVVDEKHTCSAALGSNGERPKSEGGAGCRTCWLYKDVSVQYSAHA